MCVHTHPCVRMHMRMRMHMHMQPKLERDLFDAIADGKHCMIDSLREVLTHGAFIHT